MQGVELKSGALREHFDLAISIVAHPSCDTQDVRFTLHEPAETYPLHATRD